MREDRAKSETSSGPGHYTRLAIEPAEYVAKNNLPFLVGNIIKYVSRAGQKVPEGETEVEAAVRDLRKAIRCAEMQINHLEGRHVAKDV